MSGHERYMKISSKERKILLRKLSEENVIRKRKRKACAVHMLYRMFWLLPLCKKKIVFTTFEGSGGFCCNPRYIAEEMIKRGSEYEMIWLVNNMERQFPKGIRKVKNTFLNRVYHLATAKVWVDNSRKEYGTAKRKGQLYIQTWHAALILKPVGKFRGKLFPRMAYLVSRYDSKLIDYVISNSVWCTKRYPKMLLYNGNVIETGSPRCDIFSTKREQLYKEIRDRYHIPEDAKIVMFAPTFRGGSQKGKRLVLTEHITLDNEAVRRALKDRFGGEWYVLLRLHPQLSAYLKEVPLKNKSARMVDVSQADDMNEIMAAADVLITDYSSSAFDAINMYIPVFLYIDDLDEYIQERGRLMWDIEKLPFSTARTNEELTKNIIEFNEAEYTKTVDVFSRRHGVVEDGKASGRVVDIIEEFIGQK